MDIVEEIINDEKDAKRVYYFRKFLLPVVVLTIIIAIAIASYNYYLSRKEEHSQKIGDMFVSIITGNMENASLEEESLKEIIQNSDVRIAELARIKLIHNNIQKNDISAAKSQLQEIIDDSSVLEMTKSYAHLVLISTILDQKEISDSDQLQVSNLLHYFNDKNKMFYANGQLLKALFHFRTKQFDIAEKISDEIIMMRDIPSIVKDQANALKVMIKYTK